MLPPSGSVPLSVGVELHCESMGVTQLSMAAICLVISDSIS